MSKTHLKAVDVTSNEDTALDNLLYFLREALYNPKMHAEVVEDDIEFVFRDAFGNEYRKSLGDLIDRLDNEVATDRWTDHKVGGAEMEKAFKDGKGWTAC